LPPYPLSLCIFESLEFQMLALNCNPYFRYKKKGVSMINAMRYTKDLEESGFSKEQANTTVKVLMEIMDSKFSTKQDIQFSELAVRSDMKEMEQSIRADMKEMEFRLQHQINELRSEMRAMEYRLTVKLMGSMVASVGLFATVIKIF
jgi:biopolymer transport protein ExbB/TolQ